MQSIGLRFGVIYMAGNLGRCAQTRKVDEVKRMLWKVYIAERERRRHDDRRDDGETTVLFVIVSDNVSKVTRRDEAKL